MTVRITPDTVATGTVRLGALPVVTPRAGACLHDVAPVQACTLCTPVQAPSVPVRARKARPATVQARPLTADVVARATARALAPVPDDTVRPVRNVPGRAYGSLDPVMVKVDAPSERATRDALPQSLWHGVGFHGDADTYGARFAFIATDDDRRDAVRGVQGALGAYAPTQGRADGTAPDAVARRNGRNRANRARRVLARARATGRLDAWTEQQARALAGSGRLLTASGVQGANVRERAQSRRQQAPAGTAPVTVWRLDADGVRVPVAPVVAPVETARTTGAGWAGVHATD